MSAECIYVKVRVGRGKKVHLARLFTEGDPAYAGRWVDGASVCGAGACWASHRQSSLTRLPNDAHVTCSRCAPYAVETYIKNWGRIAAAKDQKEE